MVKGRVGRPKKRGRKKGSRNGFLMQPISKAQWKLWEGLSTAFIMDFEHNISAWEEEITENDNVEWYLKGVTKGLLSNKKY